MKRLTLGSMLAAMTFSTTVLAAAAGPQWTRPVGPPDPHDTMRCMDLPFEWSPYPSALNRIEWATQCGVISDRVHKLFFYEWSDEGLLVERVAPVYPLFAHTDASGNFTSVWQPDMTKDTAGHYVSCTVPPDVVWYKNCLPM